MEDFPNKAKYNELSVEVKYPIIGFSTKLKGIKHITDFFQKELEFWMSSTGKGAQPIASFITHFQNCVNQLQAFERNHRDSDDNAFNNNWANVANTVRASKSSNNDLLLSSKSPEGEFVFKVFEEHQTQGLKAYEFITNIGLSFTSKDHAIGYLKAYEFLMQDESRIKRRRDSEKDAFRRIRSDWNQKTVDLQTEFNANVQTYEEWREGFTGKLEEWETSLVDKIETWHTERDEKFEAFFEASNQKIDDLEKLYTEKLRLEGPVQYWTTRAKELKKAGRWWAGGLTASIIITAAIILVVLFIPPDYFSASIIKGDPLAIKGVILFGTLISFLAYLIKTFSKMTFSSFHLMRDAQEREGLTMVYLALLEKGAATKEERELVLQAIFSRSETGLIKHESGPSMPGLQGLLDRVNKS